MPRTQNLHVTHTMPLTSPAAIKAELPLADRAADSILDYRQQIRAIITGADRRPLLIVGPCSIHDPIAGRDYASRLQELASELAGEMLICMRVYFEKPRTSLGWKGLINDPHLDDSYDLEAGLRLARSLVIDLAEMGLATATEFLDPITPQYLADGICWTAIGARTTESQTHRQMASGLSMPVGFKNGTDGSLAVAVGALLSCAAPHRFLGIDDAGRVATVQTDGNPDGHIVLRGGTAGPNYSRAAIAAAVDQLQAAGVCPRLLVDCSHGNSGKDPARQLAVLDSLAEAWTTTDSPVLGAMLESNLVAGRQELGRPLVYGQSITDACLDFASTATALRRLAEQLAQARHRLVEPA